MRSHRYIARRSTRLKFSPLLSLLVVACGAEGASPDDSALGGAADTAVVATETVPEGPSLPVGPTSELPPNELGQIMVLEYHRLGEPQGEWYRSVENFRNDLRLLYERGYRPVTMRQVVEGDIDLPAGTSPVVFTVDDSSLGQFYYLEDGSIDPNTMVGMWDSFQQENPAWHNGAVWCVLPAADHPSNFFGERASREVPRAEREETIRRKMTYLVENRHEICNHTLYHARLDRGTDAQVQEWLGRGQDSIQVYLPEGYEIVTHALPLGMWPANRELAWKGTWPGRSGEDRPVSYEYSVVLEVTGGPNVSPFDTRFNGHSVNRLIVAPGALERQLDLYDREPLQRYVSDGDPRTIAVPRSLQDRVDRNRWQDREIRIVEPEAGAEARPQG
jgi:peptidoglycan/xylan/chitin deacetylase (PgdA/CDA1 family)